MIHFSKIALFGLLLVTLATLVNAAAPPSNTIPIISHRTGLDATCEYITMDVLLDILWHNFDGIFIGGKFTSGNNYISDPIALCDSTDAVVILNAFRLGAMSSWPSSRWARYTPALISASNAFIHPNDDYSLVDSTRTATLMDDFIIDRCSPLCDSVPVHESIWYLEVFDEPSAHQLYHMLDSDEALDDYFPSLFTQDTMLTTILQDGVFAWIKYKADSTFRSDTVYCPSVSTTFSMLHTIDSLTWAGFGGISLGSDTIQANSIRAYFEMQYLQYNPQSLPGDTLDNTPDRLAIDAYPIRLAGYYWQTVTADSITVLGSATDLWMLEHYENLMDSTFIPAGSHEDGPFTVNYVPQSYGRCGGEAIWDISGDPPDTTIKYNPYAYRIPSPAEFRMLCNIGLLRGAKGVFPFTISSYDHWDETTLFAHNAGLLDINLIPFDDPYENWVYRDRNSSDYWYAPPDSIPPWTAADDSQFDPLYSVNSRPVPAQGSQRNTENYLVWKFAPYGRLWNSLRGTFRQIAWVAPELSQLWWWFSGDKYDNATIEYDGTEPQHFADPHIRVFTNTSESTCYLYYVNRFCRANSNPFEIEVDANDFPDSVDFSEYALDHSRRFLIEGDETGRDIFTFLDTLDAGEARLLEMIDGSLAADLRITDPDLFVVMVADGDTLENDFSSFDSVAVDVVAPYYNMGTADLRNIVVYLKNETTNEIIARDTLSFSGLSTDTCYQPDRSNAIFSWTPDASEIGVNVLNVYTETIFGEPDPNDNSATLVYFVKPGDYASQVLDDPWDMTEATLNPPAWKTDDIVGMSGWNSTLYTDSISGMFEGVITNPSASNSMELNLGTGSSYYIDTYKYQNISLAGKAVNDLDITVHWLDEDSVAHDVDLGIALDDDWAELGPVSILDLDSDWDDSDAIRFWLEFSSDSHTSATAVRIGWIKLTE